MRNRRDTGQRGEAIAAAYLQRKGYGIIAANWRCAYGELDLIMRDGAELVFVEVRTRRSTIDGLAQESVTAAKQRRLAGLADAYLQHLDEAQTPWDGPWRIDVVAVQLVGDHARVQHIQSAVEAIEEQ